MITPLTIYLVSMGVMFFWTVVFATREYHKTIWTLGDLGVHLLILGFVSILPIFNTLAAIVSTVVGISASPIWSKRI